MTDRLYYENSYLTEFEAQVLEVRPEGEGWVVRLDRSAFYPTSGGQPFDTGTLGGRKILDVYVDGDGEVWHKLDGELEVGAQVAGQIDWARRFDHMQQHAGEHMLAGAVHRLLGGRTIGLHCGADISSIDVDMPGGRTRIDEREIQMLEDEVNDEIQKDVPIRCWFPDEAELKSLPLRKAPSVTSHVRVVAIGEKEYCACGGTHPSSSGQIGLMKLVDVRPSKGKMRMFFLCGKRAYADYQARMRASDQAAALLSASVEDLPQAVAHTLEKLKQAEMEIARMRREAALERVEELMQSAQPMGEYKLIKAHLGSADMETLKQVAGKMIEQGRVVALLAARGEKSEHLLFARSGDAPGVMGKLMTEAARAHGGKGGGKPDFAQGSAADALALDTAEALLRAQLG